MFGRATITLGIGPHSSSFYLSSSICLPRLISAVADWMSIPYFRTWCGLCANLGCRSETCCTRIAGNAGRKNSPKIAIWAPSNDFAVGHIFANKAHINNREKLLNSNISSTCPHNMANFGPLTAEVGLPVWGSPANFNRFRVLASLLQRRRSPEANQTLHDLWPSPGLVYCIYILGAFAP